MTSYGIFTESMNSAISAFLIHAWLRKSRHLLIRSIMPTDRCAMTGAKENNTGRGSMGRQRRESLMARRADVNSCLSARGFCGGTQQLLPTENVTAPLSGQSARHFRWQQDFVLF
jgi:hypothetical protein